MAKDQMDFLLDATTGDLKVHNGDLVVGEATLQHQELIIIAPKGGFKHSPMLGVDIFSFINDEENTDLMREIRLQFTNDGMTIDKAVKQGENVKIDAYYE